MSRFLEASSSLVIVADCETTPPVQHEARKTFRKQILIDTFLQRLFGVISLRQGECLTQELAAADLGARECEESLKKLTVVLDLFVEHLLGAELHLGQNDLHGFCTNQHRRPSKLVLFKNILNIELVREPLYDLRKRQAMDWCVDFRTRGITC